MLNALSYPVDPPAQIINLIPIQLNIAMAISGCDVLSKMATTMLDIEHQKLIHLKVAVGALNVLCLKCIEVIMQIAVDNDKVDSIL